MKLNSGDKKKIIFIYPPSPALETCRRVLQPTDLLSLAAIAESCGFESKIIDCRIEDLNSEKFSSEFKSSQYLFVNITIENFKFDMELTAKIKQQYPALTIIVKGMPFLTYNINAIYENPHISYIILGEPEFTLKEILEGIPDNEILGICYSENMQGVKNEARPLIENLDELPLPARHLIENKNYKTIIDISRGCPCNCFSCPVTPYTGNKLRTRSVDNVILEIKECIEKHHIKTFLLNSGVFSKDWLTEFCNKYIKTGIKNKWSINLIPKSIDEELVKLLKKSGCRVVNLEVESGSAEILKNIGKDLTIAEIKKTVSILKKYHIKTNNRFILGLPWETKKTIQESIDFAIELDSDYVYFEFAKPYPGTKFFTYAMLNRLCPANLSFDKTLEQPLVRSHALSIQEIFELRNKGLMKFFLRPKSIVRKLLNIRSFNELILFLKFIILKKR